MLSWVDGKKKKSCGRFERVEREEKKLVVGVIVSRCEEKNLSFDVRVSRFLRRIMNWW